VSMGVESVGAVSVVPVDAVSDVAVSDVAVSVVPVSSVAFAGSSTPRITTSTSCPSVGAHPFISQRFRWTGIAALASGTWAAVVV